MSIQRELEEHRKKKEEIINDMKVCITYTKNQDNDLLCLMEQYLKAEKEKRPRLLSQIKRCMDGEDYENPFAAYYGYFQDDIARFDQILNKFIDHIKTHSQNASEVRLIVQLIVIELNNLNTSCRGQLIDTYRREKLISYLEEAGWLVKCDGIKNIINEHRTW
ncbi:MAG TPA: hypothetical protein VHT34_02940 [Clostridia bacterium]|nr:hypothetical protein [Clostridia bacterium]